jgi:hypothetical protein
LKSGPCLQRPAPDGKRLGPRWRRVHREQHLPALRRSCLSCDSSRWFFARTSGSAANLASAINNIEFIPDRVEQVKSFADLLHGHDIVVDAMGWTSHLEAFDDPEYDLALNLSSHLVVTRAMPIARPR